MSATNQALIVLTLAVVVAYFTKLGPFKSKSIQTETIDAEYDYVIIGGGSAGSVLAARLSEDKTSKVLLLEAGGSFEEDPNFNVPLFSGMFFHSEYDWGYYTEPQVYSGLGLRENKIYWPRGRVLSGSGSINALMYTRGSRLEFDQWATNGCPGWSYTDVLPYFLKSEDIQIDDLKSSTFHNTGGPIAVSAGGITPMADLYMKAGQEMGYNITDYNSADNIGFSRIQNTVRNGVRSSPGLEFLGSLAHRENLHVAIRSFVTKIEIQENRATGVYYIRNGNKYFVSSKKEVILSAGALNSPQLLMLSGVGPKDHLTELGIPVIADLPVGMNLQDHPTVFMFSDINKPYTITEDSVNNWWTKLQYSVFGRGVMSYAGIDGTGFFHLNESKAEQSPPDIQFVLFSGCTSSNLFNFKDSVVNEYLAKSSNVNGFSTVVVITQPKSRGRVKLRSSDPFEYPIMNPEYLTEKEDISNFIGGIRLWEKYIQTPTMKELGVDINQLKLSFCSDHEFRSDAYWECFVRHMAVTGHHQCGTCKMGDANDLSAVVDPELRVKGLQGLRVVDASIFPNVTTGNTNAPVVMVAEKAADMIRGINSVKHLKRSV